MGLNPVNGMETIKANHKMAFNTSRADPLNGEGKGGIAATHPLVRQETVPEAVPARRSPRKHMADGERRQVDLPDTREPTDSQWQNLWVPRIPSGPLIWTFVETN